MYKTVENGTIKLIMAGVMPKHVLKMLYRELKIFVNTIVK